MRRPLVITAAGFVLGEVLALQCITAVEAGPPARPLEAAFIAVFAAAAAGLCLVLFRSYRRSRRQKSQDRLQKNMQGGGVHKRALLLFLMLLTSGLLAGNMRGAMVKGRLDKEEESAGVFQGARALVRGRIKALEYKDDTISITLDDSEVEAGKKTVCFERILLYGENKTKNGSQEGKGRQEASVQRDENRNQNEKGQEESLAPEMAEYLRMDRRGGGMGDGGKSDPSLSPGQRLAVGMEIQARGKLEAVEGPRNPGEFDFRSYYRSKGLSARMFADDIKITGGDIVPYDTAVGDLRTWCGRILDRICRPEDSSVFKAVLLGDSSDMAPKIRTMYQRHGISHLLAVSGQHLAIIGGGIYLLLRRLGLGYGKAGITGAFLVVSYGYLTGSSGSAMRAVIMILCIWLAAREGRSYDTLSALGLAALILLWREPYLIFQSGFQLSFGAVLAIGGLGRWLIMTFEFEKSWHKTIVISLCVQIVLTPIVLYHYYQHPLYGMALNLLVIPLISILMYSGLIGIILGSFWLKGGMAAVGAGHYVLCFYEWLCRQVENLPHYCLVMGRPSWARIAVYGVGIAGAMVAMAAWKREALELKNKKRTDNKRIGWPWKALSVTACAYAFSFLALFPPSVNDLEVICLDVGQGDGIVMLSKGCTILMDGGSSSEKNLGGKTLEPFLKSRGISEINYAIVSHGDIDHISGLKYLLEESPDMTIRNMILPVMGKGQEVYEDLEKLAAGKGTQVAYMGASGRVNAGGMELTCLYAGESGGKGSERGGPDGKDRNGHSLVICADYGGFHMLFTGDMGKDQEKALLMQAEETDDDARHHLEHVQVLKTAHHGSGTSSSEEFLDYIAPGLAVISYGRGNSYGHPSPEILERMKKRCIPVMETGFGGAVILKTDGQKVRGEYFLPWEQISQSFD